MKRSFFVAALSVVFLSSCKEDVDISANEYVKEDCSINAYGNGSCVFRNTSDEELEKCVTVQLERISGFDCSYKRKGALGGDLRFTDTECINSDMNYLNFMVSSNSKRLISNTVCSGLIAPKGVVERSVLGFPEAPISICNPWPESCNFFVEPSNDK